MLARLVSESPESVDRRTFAEWRRAHELGPIPPDALPRCGTAITGEHGRILAMAFLSMDDTSEVARIVWPITNPDVSPQGAQRALDRVVRATVLVARDLGHSLLFASSNREDATDSFELSGFARIHEAVTELALRVSPTGGVVGPLQPQLRCEAFVHKRATELHAIATPWWQARSCPVPPFLLLPCTGILVQDEDQTPVAVAWAYRDNSAPIWSLAWTVTNPENNPSQNYEALSALIEAAVRDAANEGCTVLLASSHHHSTARIYERHGFEVVESNVTQLALDPKPTILEENQPVVPRDSNP